jgi:hypothetical protein
MAAPRSRGGGMSLFANLPESKARKSEAIQSKPDEVKEETPAKKIDPGPFLGW